MFRVARRIIGGDPALIESAAKKRCVFETSKRMRLYRPPGGLSGGWIRIV